MQTATVVTSLNSPHYLITLSDSSMAKTCFFTELKFLIIGSNWNLFLSMSWKALPSSPGNNGFNIIYNKDEEA